MRTPSASERRLLLIFGATIAVFLNVLAIKWYGNQAQKMAASVRLLEAEQTEHRLLLEEAPHWQARHQWLLAHPPEVYAGRESDSRFTEGIQHRLTETGLVIDSQQLRESERAGTLVTTSLELTVHGGFEPLVRWLNDVQQPGNHFAVENLTLKRRDDGTMTARLQIRKIFRSGNIASRP